ncbi:hypothetical protein BO86DRAFT_399172 [Aspergillus japonicus CBS 114.51]|uniref:Uncharacterized protein n=1 Tax=Aspergillus japonicus CBS 114.51 TaxID=1448312 RepID=A0A8T8X2D3_ASPJA|nr:hypothetical protein BO86DRAFT_399172 [Aspergillus japonicus CBS 114.51]RAH82215.1 hypothetical protein BO86DRAFT_399172 [Aspergillus japonicus CBS 114.51]
MEDLSSSPNLHPTEPTNSSSSPSPLPILTKETVQENPTTTCKPQGKSRYPSLEANPDTAAKLKRFAQRQFIAGFDNTRVEWPVKGAFPEIESGHPYKQAVERVRKFYGIWKSHGLKHAPKCYERWVLSQPENERERLAQCTDFKELRCALSAAYDVEWASYIFSWATSVVSFQDCSSLGQEFLKYCTIQLMVRAHLTALRQKSSSPSPELAKFDRRYLLASFDGLHTHEKWRNLTVEDFPFRSVPALRKRACLRRVDMNADSDGDVEIEGEQPRTKAPAHRSPD